MIRKNKIDIVAINKFKVPIQSVYKFGILLWQAVRSCFGSGFWVNAKPWLDDEAWKNQ